MRCIFAGCPHVPLPLAVEAQPLASPDSPLLLPARSSAHVAEHLLVPDRATAACSLRADDNLDSIQRMCPQDLLFYIIFFEVGNWAAPGGVGLNGYRQVEGFLFFFFIFSPE